MKQKAVAKTKTPIPSSAGAGKGGRPSRGPAKPDVGRQGKSLSTAEKTAHVVKSRTTGATFSLPPDEPSFREVLALIERAQDRAYQAVNTELIDLYWRVGEHISRKLRAAEWGENVVGLLAQYIHHRLPNLRGFSRPNLFRMKGFYEAYSADAIVSPLVRQLPWTMHLTG